MPHVIVREVFVSLRVFGVDYTWKDAERGWRKHENQGGRTSSGAVAILPRTRCYRYCLHRMGHLKDRPQASLCRPVCTATKRAHGILPLLGIPLPAGHLKKSRLMLAYRVMRRREQEANVTPHHPSSRLCLGCPPSKLARPAQGLGADLWTSRMPTHRDCPTVDLAHPTPSLPCLPSGPPAGWRTLAGHPEGAEAVHSGGHFELSRAGVVPVLALRVENIQSLCNAAKRTAPLRKAQRVGH